MHDVSVVTVIVHGECAWHDAGCSLNTHGEQYCAICEHAAAETARTAMHDTKRTLSLKNTDELGMSKAYSAAQPLMEATHGQ